MGGARALWGLGWRLGWPSPATHAGLSHTTRQCTHSSAPSGFLLLWFPILNPLAQATTSLREDGALSPRQQPPGLMEKTGERTVSTRRAKLKDGWREPWTPLWVGRKLRSPLKGPWGVEDRQLDASDHRLISLRGEPQVVGGPQVA